MASYEVLLPIVGYAYATVEADSKEEAWEKACDEVTTEDFEEWYPLSKVTQGNVCYHPTPERKINELLT